MNPPQTGMPLDAYAPTRKVGSGMNCSFAAAAGPAAAGADVGSPDGATPCWWAAGAFDREHAGETASTAAPSPNIIFFAKAVVAMSISPDGWLVCEGGAPPHRQREAQGRLGDG